MSDENDLVPLARIIVFVPKELLRRFDCTIGDYRDRTEAIRASMRRQLRLACRVC